MDTVLLLCQGGWTAFLSQGHVKHLFPHTLTYTNGTRLADFHYSDGGRALSAVSRCFGFCIDGFGYMWLHLPFSVWHNHVQFPRSAQMKCCVIGWNGLP